MKTSGSETHPGNHVRRERRYQAQQMGGPIQRDPVQLDPVATRPGSSHEVSLRSLYALRDTRPQADSVEDIVFSQSRYNPSRCQRRNHILIAPGYGECRPDHRTVKLFLPGNRGIIGRKGL